MNSIAHDLAPQHLPFFIVAPGETDRLFVNMTIAMVLLILTLGNFYFKLHALPEHMAKHANSTQLHLIGVLALIALFTHNNVFWILALLIAAVELPDFSAPLNSIARSLRALAPPSADEPPETAPADEPEEPEEPVAAAEEPVAATHGRLEEKPQ